MLTTLKDMLTESLGPLGPLAVVGILGIILIAAVLPTLMKKRADPYAKLRGATVQSAAAPFFLRSS